MPARLGQLVHVFVTVGEVIDDDLGRQCCGTYNRHGRGERAATWPIV
jgi:hypothetical protein